MGDAKVDTEFWKVIHEDGELDAELLKGCSAEQVKNLFELFDYKVKEVRLVETNPNV